MNERWFTDRIVRFVINVNVIGCKFGQSLVSKINQYQTSIKTLIFAKRIVSDNQS